MRHTQVPMKRRVHYAWVILGLTSLALISSSGARAVLAVFIKPMEDSFDTARATISLAASFGVLIGALSQPLVGQLLDRYGPRVIVSVACVLVVGVGALASSVITAPWQLYLTYGLTAGLGGGTVATGVVARWFARDRGMAIAIAQSGQSVGQVLMVPLATALALEMGWRNGYMVIGLSLVLVLFPLLFWLMRDDPADVGLTAFGEQEPAEGAGPAPSEAGAGQTRPPRPALLSGSPWLLPARLLRLVLPPPPTAALHSREFWLLAGSFFVCGFTSGGLVGTHLMAWADDHHFPAMASASAYGVMAIFNMPSAIGAGWVSDRFSRKNLLAAVYFTRGLALLYLINVTDVVGLNVFAVLMGMSWFATVPPTAALSADVAGKGSAASVYGWVFLSHQVGNAVAAWAAGAMYDAMGTYNWAILFAGLTDFVAAGLAFMIRERGRPSQVSRPEAQTPQMASTGAGSGY